MDCYWIDIGLINQYHAPTAAVNHLELLIDYRYFVRVFFLFFASQEFQCTSYLVEIFSFFWTLVYIAVHKIRIICGYEESIFPIDIWTVEYACLPQKTTHNF